MSSLGLALLAGSPFRRDKGPGVGDVALVRVKGELTPLHPTVFCRSYGHIRLISFP